MAARESRPRAIRSAPIARLDTGQRIPLSCKDSIKKLVEKGGEVRIRAKANVRGRNKWIYGMTTDIVITANTRLRWFDYHKYYKDFKDYIIIFNDILEGEFSAESEEQWPPNIY